MPKFFKIKGYLVPTKKLPKYNLVLEMYSECDGESDLGIKLIHKTVDGHS